MAQRTYALVISIGTYTLGKNWGVPALDDDAERFMTWLRNHGVPKENIRHLRASNGTAGSVSVLEALAEQPPPDLDGHFWLFWSGHGMNLGDENRPDIRLILSDASTAHVTNIALDDILQHLRSGELCGVRQTIIVDACLTRPTFRGDHVGGAIGLPRAGGTANTAVSQQAWLATAINFRSTMDGEKGGLFAAAVQESLERADTLEWEPTSRELAELMKEMAPEYGMKGTRDQTPISLRHRTLKGDNECDQFYLPSPPVQVSREAWHLPSDWTPGDLRPSCPGWAHPARIDVLWGLDRGPFRGVVADRPDTDVAMLLWSIELDTLATVLIPVGAGGGAFSRMPHRRWFSLPDVGSAHPPRTLEALERAVLDESGLRTHLRHHPRGASIGLVVRCEQGRPRFESPASVYGFLAELAATWPEAALIVHVVADFPHQAMEVAAVVGKSLPGLCGESDPVILTRVLPAAGKCVDPVGSDGDHGDLQAIRDLRSAHTRSGQAATDPRSYPVLDELELMVVEGIALRDLARTLRKAWDATEPSELHRALLRRSAGCSDRVRYVCLAAAVPRDDDLDLWLTGAAEAGRPADPDRLPAGLFPQGSIDAVVLAILRRSADPETVRRRIGPWWHLVSTPVRETAGHLTAPGRADMSAAARDATDRGFLLGLTSIPAAEVALRAGVGAHLGVGDLCPDGRPGPAAWAALVRRSLDDAAAGLIAGWPLPLRRVVGLVGLSESRAEPSADTVERLASARLVLRPRIALPASFTIHEGRTPDVPRW
ncbi:serine/threonine-protein kinase [Nocardia tengchongensis]|uniref:hypothetical protein n=1 Tax=Nocardia tengchongensis TaxID=2055889 RepID=UPI0036C0EF6A